MPITDIVDLDENGRGIGFIDQLPVYIANALPGERVEFALLRQNAQGGIGRLLRTIRTSPNRVVPACSYFGLCGGCGLQHLHATAQVAMKQKRLEHLLAQAGVKPEQILAPIYGPTWHYRHRARLTVGYMPKKNSALVGFYERVRSLVMDMHHCAILPPAVSALLDPLRELVAALSIKEQVPQIEVAVGDVVIALVLQILAPLSPADEALIQQFAQTQGVQIWLQPQGPDTAALFFPLDAPALGYQLSAFNLRFNFGPTEFTQVNPGINHSVVQRAVQLLDPQPGERVADMFCGLGNFSLPLATRGAHIIGVEGSAALVARAAQNAELNKLAANTEFHAQDLFWLNVKRLHRTIGPIDKMLIDPPREGAESLIRAFAGKPLRRIVYVSCQPETLARDAAMLVHTQGYRLTQLGVANMFTHTMHVESIAVFEPTATNPKF